MARKRSTSKPVAVEPKPTPPSVSIRGAQANKIKGNPGQRVTFTVVGKLMEHGISEYEREPHARIEIARISTARKKKGK